MNAKNGNGINEQVLEIRYKPVARVIDHRGTWANQLANQFNLSEWRITQNRIDVHQKDNLERVFISFKNSGCVLRNKDENDFIQLTQKFLKFVLKQSPFKTLGLTQLVRVE